MCDGVFPRRTGDTYTIALADAAIFSSYFEKQKKPHKQTLGTAIHLCTHTRPHTNRSDYYYYYYSTFITRVHGGRSVHSDSV